MGLKKKKGEKKPSNFLPCERKEIWVSFKINKFSNPTVIIEYTEWKNVV